MDHQEKLKENVRLIENYDAFLPECDNFDDRLKLFGEIARLNEENKHIKKMSVEKSKNPINSYTLQAPAML